MPMARGAKFAWKLVVLLLLSLLLTITTTSAGTVLAVANGFGWD